MKAEWELIHQAQHHQTARMKVINGWIVRDQYFQHIKPGTLVTTEAMVFVPDTKHEWTIERSD